MNRPHVRGVLRRSAIHIWGESGPALCLPLPWSRGSASRHDVGGRPVAQTLRRRRGANVAWCLGGIAGESPRTREGRRPDRPELQWSVISSQWSEGTALTLLDDANLLELSRYESCTRIYPQSGLHRLRSQTLAIRFICFLNPSAIMNTNNEEESVPITV